MQIPKIFNELLRGLDASSINPSLYKISKFDRVGCDLEAGINKSNTVPSMISNILEYYDFFCKYTTS